MKKELAVFADFIRSKGMRQTRQREQILRTFLGVEGHISAQELYKLVKSRYPEIGYVTVYRTMRLLFQAGLCGESDFGYGFLRFEHKYDHSHHDHLVCTRCGKLIEVRNRRIEELQEEMARSAGFTATDHKLEIFGICKDCLR